MSKKNYVQSLNLTRNLWELFKHDDSVNFNTASYINTDKCAAIAHAVLAH